MQTQEARRHAGGIPKPDNKKESKKKLFAYLMTQSVNLRHKNI